MLSLSSTEVDPLLHPTNVQELITNMYKRHASFCPFLAILTPPDLFERLCHRSTLFEGIGTFLVLLHNPRNCIYGLRGESLRDAYHTIQVGDDVIPRIDPSFLYCRVDFDGNINLRCSVKFTTRARTHALCKNLNKRELSVARQINSWNEIYTGNFKLRCSSKSLKFPSTTAPAALSCMALRAIKPPKTAFI